MYFTERELFDLPALTPLLSVLQSKQEDIAYPLRMTDALKAISEFHAIQAMKTLQTRYDNAVTRIFGNDIACKYVSTSVLGAAWADCDTDPLRPGQRWNAGPRASLTGMEYSIDPKTGWPVNPYIQTGIAGQGVNGPFGPSHIVDLALFEINNRGQLCLRAISKGNRHFLCGGYVNYSDGPSEIDQPARLIHALACEMFEELISGSVHLLPDHQVQLERKVTQYIESRQARNAQYVPSDSDIKRITREQETQLKLQQVQERDPAFWERLLAYCGQTTCSYRGLIYSSNRNTDNAWVETAMHWHIMDRSMWKDLCGRNPVFNYEFAAGDDAEAQDLHVIDPQLLAAMPGSHAAMTMYAFAHYAATCPAPLSDTLLRQFRANIAYMVQACEANRPDPSLRGALKPRTA